MSRSRATRARRVAPALLRKWALPMPQVDDDKTERGRLLVVAGSGEIPGAAILAANAALRSGVGKVSIATDSSIAAAVAVAVPEARVVRLDDASLVDEADRFDALLVGPGMSEPRDALRTRIRELATRMPRVVVDAGALDMIFDLAEGARGSEPKLVITPHMGEMAHLLQREKDDVESRAGEIALEFAAAHGVVVALKGACTFIADPDGELWIHDKGNVGLAVSGSGDVLAGIVAALVARGASCAQAAVWGVALHAQAGRRMVQEHGELGGLARELPALVPAALREFASR